MYELIKLTRLDSQVYIFVAFPQAAGGYNVFGMRKELTYFEGHFSDLELFKAEFLLKDAYAFSNLDS